MQRTRNSWNRRFAAYSALGLALATSTSSASKGQSISEIESQLDSFISEAQSLYRIDKANLELVWEAYCGVLDPSYSQDRQYAATIGQELQRKEREILEALVAGEAPRLKAAAKRLIANGDSTKRAEDLIYRLEREESKLLRLDTGVVLRGSDHPFVQAATDYGQRRHKEMCGQFRKGGEVCDRDFPGANGRPDLVTVTSDGLTIYEFKPNNRKAMDAGEEQIKKYVRPVENYFQTFFPDGPTGNVVGEPPSHMGGREILDALKASSSSWNGKYVQVARARVEPYDMCAKPSSPVE